MNMKYYILDKNHVIKMTHDFFEWATQMEHCSRIVEQTTGFDGEEIVTVSTIFLGLNHRFDDTKTPLLFETMIFGGKHDQDMQRYCTWEAAETGHREICEKLGLKKKFVHNF